MRISDWSSDVCSSDLLGFQRGVLDAIKDSDLALLVRPVDRGSDKMLDDVRTFLEKQRPIGAMLLPPISENDDLAALCEDLGVRYVRIGSARSEEHTSELQSLMRISYAVFCLKKKKTTVYIQDNQQSNNR